MADSTIPALPAFTGTPNGTEVIETVQSGVSVKIASQAIADLATIVTPITKAALISLGGLNQISVYKLYLITNATAGRLLVKGETTSTLEDGVLNMSTGQSGNYVLGTDTFTAASGGNTNTVYITKAALIALELGGTLSLTTRYRVTDATPFIMEVVPETVSQLSHTATIVDDGYSGLGHWNPTTDVFFGTIQDSASNIFNGVLPSGITLGTSTRFNIFNQETSSTVLGNSCTSNIFETGATGNTLGNDCTANTFKQASTGFIFRGNLNNTTIEAGLVGANYTATPDYDFLYSNAYPSTIFTDGTNNYHRYYDPANGRIVVTLMTAPFTVSYIGGSGSGDMILASAQTNTGLKTFLNASFGLRNIANTFTSFFSSAATAARTWTLQDRNGTLADDTDLALKADIASPTFTGTATTPAIIVSSETASRIAILDASKNIKSADTATYPSLTELSYGKGVTSAIQTQLNTKVYAVQCGAAIQAVVSDSTNYHMGIAVAATLNTTAALRRFKFTDAGTLKTVSWNLFQTVNGSGETVNLYLRNETAGTDASIGTFTSNFGASAVLSTLFTGLSITVNTTDDYTFKITTPAFATNPTNWLPAVILSITP